MKEKLTSLADKIRRLGPSLRRIWDGYGYYISLAVLLTIFGTVAYMYRTGSSREYAAVPETEFEARPAIAYSTPRPTATPEPETGLLMPVNGEIINGYSPDDLMWDKILGQWRAHPGVDITAAQGEVVAACDDGIITAAYEDVLYGNAVEITHNDGSISRVSPLLSLELAEIGKRVKRGEIIGCVGPEALAEPGMESHLHFELSIDGTSAEPTFDK